MDLKYWKQFENSGRIQDYLIFAACCTQERDRESRRLEEDGNAGTHIGDRDRTKDFSGGRIR